MPKGLSQPAMNDQERIAQITLDEGTIIHRTPEVEHERAVAIADLLESNVFVPAGLSCGPYHLSLSILENRLVMDLTSASMEDDHRIALALQPFKTLIRDYFMICESYYDAVKNATPSRIEAIDMGRRGIHNEGSQLLKELLEDKVTLDFETARRLFTLVCVLSMK